jgi:poly(3-hydroxybutyrate) depolymerase
LLFVLFVKPMFSSPAMPAATTSLKNGLALSLPSGRGFGARRDPVEKAIVSGTWSRPQAGDRLLLNKDTLTWIPIAADENDWFTPSFQPSGYLYATLSSLQEQVMLLHVSGSDLVYVNNRLRIGNRYGVKDQYEAWEPRFDYGILPVQLRPGGNDFLFYLTRFGRLKAWLEPVTSTISMHTFDATLPDFLLGEEIETWGAVVVINAGHTALKDASMISRLDEDEPIATPLPVIQPMTVRKIGFILRGRARTRIGPVKVEVKVRSAAGKMVAAVELATETRQPQSVHRRTFVSRIDGSVQYYAVHPALETAQKQPKALVLSVHGAAVEALNQANSYDGKTWAHIVAPTNRRPFGFNWEDWGRTDAVEVLNLAQQQLNIDPGRIYLTGHSMGGHGTWHIGAMFPDRFAALGPSAGWISFWSYRAQEDETPQTALQQMVSRAGNPSRTMEFAENYKQHGVYILHGGADKTVRPDQARSMVERLQSFHHDYYYHEEPGQDHWWDLSDAPGTDCVDWAPMFDFFARHARPEKEQVRIIEFITAHPGISSRNHWLSIESQLKPLLMSKISVQVDPGLSRFVGITENVGRLALDLSVLPGEGAIRVQLDNQTVWTSASAAADGRIYLEKANGNWAVIPKPALSQKGPHRYGTFKDAFNNRFILVYGTGGPAGQKEWAFNKARYDAEYFWYQGNGSVDVLPDVEFDPQRDPDRNVILYGNSETNSAWQSLLAKSPLQVSASRITVGDKKITGKNLACLFVRPRPGSSTATVGVISGTGISGMRFTDRLPYLSPGYAYPDFIVFSTETMDDQDRGVLAAGFFDLDWRLTSGDIAWQENQ